MKRARGVLICFSGIDGSGKSTIAKSLVVALRERGIPCRYVYNRLRPLISRPIMCVGRNLFLKNENRFENYRSYSSVKKKLLEGRFVSFLCEFAFLLDYFLQAFVKVVIPLRARKNIICDRYVYDTLITDLAVDLDYTNVRLERVLECCMLFLPRPDLVFLVDVSEEVALRRKNDVPSIEYLKERRGKYQEIARNHNMIILDGSKPLVCLLLEVEKECSEKGIFEVASNR